MYKKTFLLLLLTPVFLLSNDEQTPGDRFQNHHLWPWKIISCNPCFPAKAHDFPPDFLWGTGTSAYQVEGDCTNSSYQGWSFRSIYKEPAGIGCRHELLYEEDIQRMAHELCARAYRFSIEWSKIEPQEGIFDEQEIARYAHMCKTLVQYGIKPVIGFHHYSDPQWFIDAGGFYKKTSIKKFVRFCTKIFQAVHQATREAMTTYSPGTTHAYPMYLTFNSPSSYAAQGYLNGERPPGMRSLRAMVQVLCNMLQAHVAVYQTLKALPGGETAQIGITHNIYQLDPINPYNPIHRLRASYGNYLVHDSIIKFFTTGKFSVSIPLTISVHCTNKAAPQSLDFIGVNYYSHGKIGSYGLPVRAEHERLTDNPRYTVYAEGLYRAIVDVSHRLAQPLKIPIFITENGVGTRSDTLRDLFMKRYLFALGQAIKDGHNVKGYFCWSFMDNYEWGSYDILYGLYHVDRTIDQTTGLARLTRTLKEGARYFAQLLREHYSDAQTHGIAGALAQSIHPLNPSHQERKWSSDLDLS